VTEPPVEPSSTDDENGPQGLAGPQCRHLAPKPHPYQPTRALAAGRRRTPKTALEALETTPARNPLGAMVVLPQR
jgi:hypothetical protein